MRQAPFIYSSLPTLSSIANAFSSDTLDPSRACIHTRQTKPLVCLLITLHSTSLYFSSLLFSFLVFTLLDQSILIPCQRLKDRRNKVPDILERAVKLDNNAKYFVLWETELTLDNEFMVKNDHNENYTLIKHSEDILPLDKLNPDIMCTIFTHLNPKDMVSVLLSCKTWYKLIEIEDLWQTLCNKFVKNVAKNHLIYHGENVLET